jgi:hypothetical protein
VAFITPYTYTSLEGLTAALLNTYQRDNMNSLRAHTYCYPFVKDSGNNGSIDIRGPHTYAGTNYPVVTLGSTDSALANFTVYSEYGSPVEIAVVILPDATETVQYDLTTYYAAEGEASNTNTGSAANETAAVTATQFAHLDVSGVLASLAAGDKVGFHLKSDTDTLYLLHFLLECVN